MIKGIHHPCLIVSDLDRSVAFYRDLLGMKVTTEFESSGPFVESMQELPDASLRLALLEAQEDALELIQFVSPRGKPFDRRRCDVGTTHVCFEVDDIDAHYQDLQKKGVRFTTPPLLIDGGPLKGWRVVYFIDPDGITLELMQKPAA